MLTTIFLITACHDQARTPPTQTFDLTLENSEGQTKVVPYADYSARDDVKRREHTSSLFGRKRTYLGLDLEALKSLAGAGESDKVVAFHCRDGYVSEVKVETLNKGKFMLAFRDLGAAPAAWVPYERMTYLQTEPERLAQRIKEPGISPEEREKLVKECEQLQTLAKDMKNLKNQGPFFPIFEGNPDLPEEEGWLPPFCVEKVVFSKTPVDRSAARPSGLPENDPAMKGNKQFEQRCAVCHSINGVGGKVGPELNRPMSVTEYWDEKALRKLLRDPAQVREGSKMPAFHLPDPVIDEILAYLRRMEKEKR